jgi:hypothetical protein
MATFLHRVGRASFRRRRTCDFVELLLEQPGIYADGRGRLIFMLHHNAMIDRRPHPCPGASAPADAPSHHEVRLEYWVTRTAKNLVITTENRT